ncbi:hypothetical protein, partial [Lactococcus lactis]|uniref:hypothetical protein n=1 Tax=Lactococcus lactis TaxID=1358 RepID=UPI001C5CF0DD
MWKLKTTKTINLLTTAVTVNPVSCLMSINWLYKSVLMLINLDTRGSGAFFSKTKRGFAIFYYF